MKQSEFELLCTDMANQPDVSSICIIGSRPMDKLPKDIQTYMKNNNAKYIKVKPMDNEDIEKFLVVPSRK